MIDHVRTWVEVDANGAIVLFIGMDVAYAVELEYPAMRAIYERALDFHAGLGVHVDLICLRVFKSLKRGPPAKVAR